MKQSDYLCQIDGEYTDVLDAEDRGLLYGDGFFETILIKNSYPILMKLHWDRIKKTKIRLGFTFNLNILEERLNNFFTKNKFINGILKIIITRGRSLTRGYKSQNTSWRSILIWYPESTHKNIDTRTEIKLFDCKTQVAWQPQLAGLKHLNRLEQILARQEWTSSQYAEGLMCDFRGNIVEGVMSNVFIVHNSILKTPILTGYGVNGVMRQWILAQTNIPLKVETTTITKSDFLNSEEVFVCNSVFGIWAVVGFNGTKWKTGPITKFMQKSIEVLFNGDHKR